MPKIIQDISLSAVTAGFVTFLIGISVSSVLVIQAAQQLGASPAQISSWLWALGVGIGLSGIFLSWKYQYPVATAWSTAGLALIIATASHYSIGEAIAAFILSGILVALLGFLGIFEKIFRFIPHSLSAAMLAGVLLKFGISLFDQLNQAWGFVLSCLAIYFISKRLTPRYSILITVFSAIILCQFFVPFRLANTALQWSTPVWITPEWHWQALLGLGLPLTLIALASQYLPGLAIIQNYKYPAQVNGILGYTGAIQALLAPFGCVSVTLAAISAAVSLDEQAHPDPSKRYIAGISCGLCYLMMGCFAISVTNLLLSFPTLLITVIAGIALFATIGHNLTLAFQAIDEREAALMTFLVSASSMQLLGIGSAFWGLILGLCVHQLLNFKTRVVR